MGKQVCFFMAHKDEVLFFFEFKPYSRNGPHDFCQPSN